MIDREFNQWVCRPVLVNFLYKGEGLHDFYLKILSVPRSKHSVSVTKTSQLMLCKEIIAVFSDIHIKHMNTLCGQNVEFLIVKAGAIFKLKKQFRKRSTGVSLSHLLITNCKPHFRWKAQFNDSLMHWRWSFSIKKLTTWTWGGRDYGTEQLGI